MRQTLRHCLRALRSRTLLPLLIGFISLSSMAPAAFAQGPEGTDFFVGFPANYNDDDALEQYVRLYISSRVATNVDIYTVGGFNGSVTTVADGVVTFDLTPMEAQGFELDVKGLVPDDERLLDRAVRIVSTAPVSVYAVNYSSFSSDGMEILPVSSLGREYIVASYGSAPPGGLVERLPSQLVVAAPYDETLVTITLPTSSPNHPEGEQFQVLLYSGDLYSVMAADPGGDLTGARVRANKPIAVTAGQNCSFIPSSDYEACDHVAEMLPPVESWGKTYHALPLHERAKGETYRIIAAEPMTDVFVNGVKFATISGPGGSEAVAWINYREDVRRPLTFTAAKPIYVAQYNNGQQYDNSTSTDPFMMTLTSREQYATTALIVTPEADYPKNFFAVTGDSATLYDLEITEADQDEWQPVRTMSSVVTYTLHDSANGAANRGISRPIAPGAYRLRSSGPFGAVVYGGGASVSYGYPANLYTNDLRNGDTLAPEMFVDSVHCSGRIDVVAREPVTAGVAGITLDPLESTNYTIAIEPYIARMASRVEFTLEVEDPSKPARAVVTAFDGAGNRTLDTFAFFPTVLDFTATLVDFGTLDPDSSGTRVATLRNGGQVAAALTDLSLNSGERGFRIVQPPALPLLIDRNLELLMSIEFMGTVAGTYRDTLTLYEACGLVRSVPLLAAVRDTTTVNSVDERGVALRGMRLTVAPNVIDGDAIALDYAVPTGRSATLRLVDADGRIVSSRTLTSTGGIDRRTTLDASSLPGGRYWIALRIDGAEVIEEITVVR